MDSNNIEICGKPYKSPQLFIYGSVKELTQNSGKTTSSSDNANLASQFKTG